MNANMKRLLIFALVPITVWGIGSTFTKQKIDRIGVNTESQITMEDTTRFSSGTASTVPYLDASKDLVSSSVTPTELGYLSGVTSSIQTQIDSIQTPASGAGGSRLNLLDDSSFESGVANGSCTGCTATQDTTNYLATPNNEASLKMAFSAASGNYTWTESTSAQYSNVAGTVSAWIKTSASDCHFDELVDGTQSQTVAIGSSDEWKQYIINGTTGTTSYGWRVRCDTAITDDVFVDETFAGAAEPDTFDIGTASLWGSVKWDGTTNCEWGTTSTSYGDFSADVDCDDNARTIKGMYNSTSGASGNSDGQKPQIKFSYMPAGTYKIYAKGVLQKNNTTANVCMWRLSDGTSSTTHTTMYASGVDTIDGNLIGELSYSTSQSNVTINLQAKSPVSGNCAVRVAPSFDENLEISVYHYPSPQKVVAAKCDGLECVQSFSARFNTAGTLEDENVEWVQSVTKTSTGNYDITFKAGLFSEIPAYQVTSFESGSGGLSSYVRAISTSGMTVAFGQDGVAFADKSFSITLDRVGNDAKQFDQRMVRVIQEEDGDNWTSYTPSLVGFGTPTNNEFWWKKDGDDMLIRGYFTSGTVTATEARLPLPSGYTIGDVAGTIAPVGEFERGSAWIDGEPILAATDGETYLTFGFSTTADNFATGKNGSDLGSSQNFFVTARVPIQGWKKDVNAFIGNLTPKEFVQTPGSSMPVTYSYKFGGSGVNDSCTASPCSIKRNIGNLVTSVTRTGAGSYQATLDTTKFTSLNCTCAAHQGGISGDRGCGVYDNEGGGFSPMNIYTFAGITGTDTSVMVICHGVQ